MVKRIPFHLAIFAVLLVAVVVLAAAGQAFRPSKMRAANLLLAPQMAAAPAPIQAVPLTTPAPQRAQAVKAFAVPEPAPTPARAKDPVGSPTVYRTATLILPVALMLVFLLAFIVLSKPQWTMSDGHLSQRRRAGRAAAMLFCLFLLGCQSQATVPLPPDDYLEQALDWLEANAVRADTVDWEAVRAQAVALAGQPQTTADTYAAITYAIEQLNDPEAFLTTPQREAFAGAGLGLTAVYPQNIIIEVMAGSPAAEAGIQVGDEVLNVNGHPPSSMELHPRQVDFLYDPLAAQSIALTLMRGSKQWEVAVSEDLFNSESHPARRVFPIGQKTAAYLELPFDPGTRLYPTHVQAAMAEVDSADTCGWILDLRNTRGGDLWTYFVNRQQVIFICSLYCVYTFKMISENCGNMFTNMSYSKGKYEPWQCCFLTGLNGRKNIVC